MMGLHVLVCRFSFLASRFSFFVLGFFLFEEAAESVDGVGGSLSLPLRIGGAGGRAAADASELRFEEIFCQPADVWNEFGIGRGALNLKRNFQAATAAAAAGGAATATGNRSEEPSESIRRVICRGAY